MTNRGFDLPFVANIPVEKQIELEERASKDATYAALKEAQIAKTWRNLSSNLRKLGDYFYQHFREEISYKQIERDLKIPEACAKQIVGSLNFWREYPIRMIPVRKKKGYIQEKYLRQKSRTITSMEQVYENIDASIQIKQKKKQKIKIKNET